MSEVGEVRMRFIAVISDFDDLSLPPAVRAFHYVDTARTWVHNVHTYLFNGESEAFAASAELYRLAANGECVQIDEWSGYDRGDGLAEGWKNNCKWKHPDTQYDDECDHSPVKGDVLCRFHRRDPKHFAPQSGLMGGGYLETVPDKEYEKYKIHTEPPKWNYQWLPMSEIQKLGDLPPVESQGT